MISQFVSKIVVLEKIGMFWSGNDPYSEVGLGNRSFSP